MFVFLFSFFPDNKRKLEYTYDNCELCKAKYKISFYLTWEKYPFPVSNTVAENFATASVGPGSCFENRHQLFFFFFFNPAFSILYLVQSFSGTSKVLQKIDILKKSQVTKLITYLLRFYTDCALSLIYFKLSSVPLALIIRDVFHSVI